MPQVEVLKEVVALVVGVAPGHGRADGANDGRRAPLVFPVTVPGQSAAVQILEAAVGTLERGAVGNITANGKKVYGI